MLLLLSAPLSPKDFEFLRGRGGDDFPRAARLGEASMPLLSVFRFALVVQSSQSCAIVDS